MLRYLNAGESHGRCLIAVLEGVPAGLPLTAEEINRDLIRRQKGYGRGGRMRVEEDRVDFTAGVRKGKTLGTPIGLLIANKDWENWKEVMAAEPGPVPSEKVVTRPRPGHADLVGAIKYGHRDIRNVLEKASARETAIRVAIGGVAKAILGQFGMRVLSYTMEIGGALARRGETPEQSYERAEASDVRSPDPDAGAKMIELIRTAKHRGDTLGGVFEVVVTNPPIGLGTYAQWDRRLGARLAMAAMSIQAMKGVEIGMGFEAARRFGSEVHDDIYYEAGDRRFIRKTNNAGGLEGGITNGEPVVLRVAMKPISTLYSPKKSVDIDTKESFDATVERSDICTVPAAGVVGEAVVAFEMANALVEKFGGDSLEEMRRNYDAYLAYVKAF
jgi:chorismate synthase